MAKCSINQQQELNLARLLKKRLENLKGSFNLENEIRHIHDEILEKLEDNADKNTYAVMYARLVPKALKFVLARSSNMEELTDKLEPAQIAEIEERLREFKKDANAVVKYLNDNNQISLEDTVGMAGLIDQPTKDKQYDKWEYSVMSPSFLATITGFEREDGFTYKVLRNILKNFKGRNLIRTEEGFQESYIHIPGVGSVFFRVVPGNTTEVEFVNRDYNPKKTDVNLILVDINGKPIYFDQTTGDVSTKSDGGAVAWYTFPDIYRLKKDKDYREKELNKRRNMMAKLLFKPRGSATYVYSSSKNLDKRSIATPAQRKIIDARLKAELAVLEQITESALKDPENGPMLSIIAGSPGQKTLAPLSLFNFSVNEPFAPVVKTTKGREVPSSEFIYEGQIRRFKSATGMRREDVEVITAIIFDDNLSVLEKQDYLSRIINDGGSKYIHMSVSETLRIWPVKKKFLKGMKDFKFIINTKDLTVLETEDGETKLYLSYDANIQDIEFVKPHVDVTDKPNVKGILQKFFQISNMYHVNKEHINNNRAFWYPSLENGKIVKNYIPYLDWILKVANFEVEKIQGPVPYGKNPYVVFSPRPTDALNNLESKEVIEEARKSAKTKADTQEKRSGTKDNQIDSRDIGAHDWKKIQTQKTGEVKATLEQLKEAEKWWNNHPLKDFFKLKTMFNVINNENPNAVAHWAVNGIKLFKGADWSDSYHEAWHAFSQTFLTKEERAKLYNELRNIKGTFKDYNNTEVSFKEATDDQLEEYLAEDFRTYVLSNGTKMGRITPVKKSIFQRIYEFLKGLFTNASPNDITKDVRNIPMVNEMYENLRMGNINRTAFDPANRSFGKMYKTLERVDGTGNFSFRDSKTVVETIDSLFSTITDELNNENSTSRFTSGVYKSDKYKLNVYRMAFARLEKDYLPDLIKQRDLVTDPIVKQNIQYNIDLLTEMLANFGNLENLHENAKMRRGVIFYHMLKSNLLQKKDVESFFDSADLTEEESFIQGRQGHNRNGQENSLKDLASDDVITLIRSLHEDNSINELGVKKLVDFTKLWNYLAKNLENSVSFDDFISKLDELKADQSTIENAAVSQLLSKLGPVHTDVDASFLLWTRFWQAFNLTRVPLIQLTVKKNPAGEGVESFQITLGETFGDYKKVQRFWDAEFQSVRTKYIKERSITSDKKSGYVDSISYLDIDTVLKDFNKQNIESDPTKAYLFLNAIGIRLSPTKGILGSPSKDIPGKIQETRPFEAISYIYDRLVDLQKYKQPVRSLEDIFRERVIKTKNSEIILTHQYNRLNDLTKLEAKHGSFVSNFMVSTAEGTTQFEHSINSSLTVMVNLINQSESFEDMIANPALAHLSPEINPLIKDTVFYKSLFNPDGSRVSSSKGNPVTLLMENVSGAAVVNERDFLEGGVASASADPSTRLILDFHNVIMRGSPELMKHADKKSSYTVHLSEVTNVHAVSKRNSKTYIDHSDFLSQEGREYSLGRSTWFKVMSDYLHGEVKRAIIAREIWEKKEGKHAWDYIERGQNLVMFDDIIPKDLAEELIEHLKGEGSALFDSSDDISSFVDKLPKELSLKVERALNNYFEFILEDTQNLFDNYGSFIEPTLRSAFRRERNFKVRKGVVKKVKMTSSVIDAAMMESYVANSFIHNMESMIMFYGDLAMYKDFHKRNAGIASPGEIYRSDAAAIQYVNNAGKQYAKAMGYNDNPIHTSGEINTAVLDESITKAQYYDDYVKIIAKELFNGDKTKAQEALKAYTKQEEGDGQGWITFDFYRQLLMLQGIWTQEQEDLYQDIVAKAVAKQPIDIKTVLEFFPVKKVQYWGPVKSDGLSTMAMHKFSLMPLIPGVGGNIDKLHNRMMRHGIDYAMFDSASKIQKISEYGKSDKFYTDVENREMEYEEISFTPNVIQIQYLKDQINTVNDFKRKMTFPTQLRKLLIDGLVSNGIPHDFKADKPVNVRTAAWNKLSETQKLKNENYKLYKQYETIVNNITELKYRELLAKIDWTLDKNGKPKGEPRKLESYISKSLEAQVAAHELDMIKIGPDGKLSDLSLNFSSEKIEKLLNSIVRKQIIKQKVTGEALVQVSTAGWEVQGSEDLPFYKRGKDGKTQAMKVKIAMQGPFKKLLKLADVTELAEKRDITKLDALNQLLKNEKWVKKNSSLITLVGARIPVQGLNSMDFMEVYEFLPEQYGNIIIAPSEIVAKSGSDFDIDKLFTMMPTIIAKNGNVKLITHKPLSPKEIESREEKLSDLRIKLAETIQKYKKRIAETKGTLTDSQSAVMSNLDIEKEARLREIENRQSSLKVFKDQVRKGQAVDENGDVDEKMDQLNEAWNSIENEYNDKIKEKLREFQGPKLDPIFKSKEEELDKINNQIFDIEIEIKQASSKAAENDLLMTMKDILSLESNFTSLIMPNSTNIFDDLAEEMAPYADRIYDPTERNLWLEGDEKTSSPTKVFEIGFNLYKQRTNSVGMQVLGIGAIDNTFNTLFNRIGMHMNETNGPTIEEYEVLKSRYRTLKSKMNDREKKLSNAEKKEWKAIKEVVKKFQIQTMLLPHHTMDGKKISLSHIKDINGEQKISDVINQLINGWVDIAKDTWVFNVQGNKELASTLLFMVQAGVPVPEAVYMLSHPMVQEYVQTWRNMQSTFAGPLEALPEYNPQIPKYQATVTILDKYGIVPAKINEPREGETGPGFRFYDKVDLYDEASRLKSENSDAFTRENLKKRLDATEMEDQDLAIFVHFLEIQNMADELKKLKMNANPDTKAAKTLASASKKQFMMEELKTNKAFSSEMVKSLMENTVLKSFFNALQYQQDIWDPYFSFQTNPTLRKHMAEILKDPDVQAIKDDYFDGDIERFMDSFINDFKTFLFERQLYNFNVADLTAYNSTEVQSVKQVESLNPGVAFKDGIIYVDRAQIEKDVKALKAGRDVGGGVYPFAKVEASLFTLDRKKKYKDQDLFMEKDYMHFLFEREVLRETWPFDKLSGTYLFTQKQEQLKRQKKSLKNNEFDQMVYEEVLKDMALTNVYNIKHIFESRNSIANEFHLIKSMFPDLSADLSGNQGYSVINALGMNKKRKVSNLKLYGISSDIDLFSEFQEELQELSDPNSIKTNASYADKQLIANFFRKLPYYGILQSGFETGRALSIQRIMPSENFVELMGVVKNRVNNLTTESYQSLIEDYTSLFMDQQSKSTKLRYKDYNGAIDKYERVSEEDVIRDGYYFEGNMEITPHESNKYSLFRIKRERYIKNKEVKFKNFIGPRLVGQLRKMVEAHPNHVFVFNDVTELDASTKLATSHDFAMKQLESEFTNVIGLPVRKKFAPKSPGKLDTKDGKIDGKVKKAIDSAIDKIAQRKADGYTITFADNGYGQNMVGAIHGTSIILEGKKVNSPETFSYLSSELFSNFEYINPNYQNLTESGRSIVESNQPITSQDVLDHLRICFK